MMKKELSSTKLIAIGAMVLALPSITFGQAKMTSSNFQLDDVNFASNNSLTSTQDGIPPNISSEGPSITQITPTSVTITWRTDKKADSSINYGTTTAYGLVSGTTGFVLVHTVTLTGLKPQTTYHYQVVSTDAFHGAGKSPDNVFTTPPETGVNEFRVEDVSYTEALVTVKIGGLQELSLDYGTSPAFGTTKTVESVISVTEHSFHLTDLQSGTKYFLRLRGVDPHDNAVDLLNGITFTTIAEPSFALAKVTATGPNSLNVTGNTNTPTTFNVTYQSAQDPKPLSQADPNLASTHAVDLDHLFGDSDYRLTLLAIDAQGKRVTQTITTHTPVDKIPPVMTDPNVNVTRAGNDIVLTAKWTTNKPVKSKITIQSKINPANVKTIDGPAEYTTSPVIVAAELAPRTPYTLTATSIDNSNNTAEKSISFVTPNLRQSILDLISTNLGKVVDPILKLLKYLQGQQGQ